MRRQLLQFYRQPPKKYAEREEEVENEIPKIIKTIQNEQSQAGKTNKLRFVSSLVALRSHFAVHAKWFFQLLNEHLLITALREDQGIRV